MILKYPSTKSDASEFIRRFTEDNKASWKESLLDSPFNWSPINK